MIKYVNAEENQDTWKKYQDTLGCCGFKDNAKTGANCVNEAPIDCRTQLYAVLGDYIMFTAIALAVLTVVALILGLFCKLIQLRTVVVSFLFVYTNCKSNLCPLSIYMQPYLARVYFLFTG